MEETNFSDMLLFMKGSTLKKEENIKNIQSLILKGFSISQNELAAVHNTNIPISFYENFNISSNDFIRSVLDKLTSDNLNALDTLKQILEEILNNEIEISLVQKFLTLYPDLSLEDLDQIQQKYNIFYKPILIKHRYNNYKSFPDLYLDWISLLSIQNNKNFRDKAFNIVKYMLEFNESSWDFSPILKSAIYNADLTLIKIMLDNNVELKDGWSFSRAVENHMVQVFNLLSDYYGKEKTYNLLLTHLSNYDIKATLLTIKYMSNIKDYDETVDDLLKKYR